MVISPRWLLVGMELRSYLCGPSTGCLRVLPTLRPSYQTSRSLEHQHHGRRCFDTDSFFT